MAESPDFNKELHFPPFYSLPHEYDLDEDYYSATGSPKAHWCFLAEIKESIPWLRPMYHVTDKDGLEFLVAFHLEDRWLHPIIAERCKNGYTMCVMYAEQHNFVDGQIGVRVENERTVKILPCSLKGLFHIRAKMTNNNGVCNVCGSTATLKCSRCRLFYCGKTCQLKDWNGAHKTECKVVQQIVKWGAFDWDHFERPKLFEI
ncbi:hypothetical protein B0H19DRAFT_1252118 [Mycena capillaripes]|nr:hypothetical protein B0H19DRAFT_1252118 [Mycena capillaripes]